MCFVTRRILQHIPSICATTRNVLLFSFAAAVCAISVAFSTILVASLHLKTPTTSVDIFRVRLRKAPMESVCFSVTCKVASSMVCTCRSRIKHGFDLACHVHLWSPLHLSRFASLYHAQCTKRFLFFFASVHPLVLDTFSWWEPSGKKQQLTKIKKHAILTPEELQTSLRAILMQNVKYSIPHPSNIDLYAECIRAIENTGSDMNITVFDFL